MRGVSEAAAGVLWRIARLPADEVRATLRAFVIGLAPVRHVRTEPEQLVLVLPELVPTDTVRCEPMKATMPASSCVRQHAATIPSGRGKGAARFPACARCTTGQHRQELLALQGWHPPAHVAFSPNREKAQKARARALWLVGLGPRDEVPTLDGLPTHGLR